MRRVLVIGLLLVVPAAAGAQEASFFVFVMNQTGQPVTDLTAEEFVITQGGDRCRIISADYGDQPMKVAFLVDNSHAVGGNINWFRDGMTTFIDTLPPEHEIGLFTIGGQVRQRVAFTTDRVQLAREANVIFRESGAGTVMMDGLVETWERRFEDDDAWPVFVLIVTDGADTSGYRGENEYDAFVQELRSRSANVHAVLVSTRGGGVQTNFALNLTSNTGGLYEALAAASGLPNVMPEIATRLGQHYTEMSTSYRVVLEPASDDPTSSFEIGVSRPAMAVRALASRNLEQ